MSRRYSDEEKELVLQTLDDNFGNVSLTALQTDVPARTLHTWRRDRKLRALKNGDPLPGTLRHNKNRVSPPPPPLQTAADNEHADNEEEEESEYAYIRKRLMEHINNLLETLTDDPDTAHLRINALSRLLDRVIKLEQLVDNDPNRPQVIRVEYKDPDGSIHSTPMWDRGQTVKKTGLITGRSFANWADEQAYYDDLRFGKEEDTLPD